MRLRLELDRETIERLIPEAVAERRPIGMHAEVLIRRQLGLPDRATRQDQHERAAEAVQSGR